MNIHTYLRSGFVVTSLEKFVFASHLRKPKIRNKAHDFPKPITSQTLLRNDAIVGNPDSPSLRLRGSGKREGREKTQPLEDFNSHPFTLCLK